MSSEIDLYRNNVPDGNMIIGFGDWSSTQTEISVTASAGKKVYVSIIGFSIDDGATITAGKIEAKNDTTVIFSVDQGATVSEDFTKFFALSDPFSLKVLRLDGTNDAITGEIRFTPPVQVISGKSFTLTATSLTITAGAFGPFFTIKGWEVDTT